ncbi:hypothetical protein SASPL_151951 [Salvia splendens]|uniref:Uncharacterized protein n=1 Tax=Salvia splendens TaxID=180675 RepID=A0A8X8Z0V3_SALSN|nr:hypothetical protein SASPL_151951 [Salvia splendens]
MVYALIVSLKLTLDPLLDSAQYISESQSPGDEISIAWFSKKLIEVKDKLKAKKDEVAVLKAKKDEILKAKEELLKSQEEEEQQSADHFGADAVISSKIGFEKNNKTVGLQDEVSRLLDLLLSDNRRRNLYWWDGWHCQRDGEESWDLLCMIAFPDMQKCPLELEEIGRSITTYSDGLPLQ